MYCDWVYGLSHRFWAMDLHTWGNLHRCRNLRSLLLFSQFLLDILRCVQFLSNDRAQKSRSPILREMVSPILLGSSGHILHFHRSFWEVWWYWQCVLHKARTNTFLRLLFAGSIYSSAECRPLLFHRSGNSRHTCWSSEIWPERQEEGIPCLYLHLHLHWIVLDIWILDVFTALPDNIGCIPHFVLHFHAYARASYIPILLCEQESSCEMGWVLWHMLTILQEVGDFSFYGKWIFHVF